MSAAPSTASSSLLIAAVRRRRPLWDPADVKHHDRVTVAGLWKQISAELGISTSECKNKWHSLRSSYARYLRDSRKPSGSLRCMKKWYLADAMSFVLGDFAPCTEESNVTQTIGGTHDEESQEDFNESSEEVIIDVPVKTEITAKKLNPRRIKRKPTAELMPAYFQSYPTPQSPLKEEEESIMLFMRSILPDLQQLDAKRQWKLKKKILQDVEELLEEQEKERSRPRTSIDPKDPHGIFNGESD